MAMGSQDKHQVEKNRHFIQALGHAWDGVKDVVKKERNMRFHIIAAVLVIIVAFLMQVNVLSGCGCYRQSLSCLRLSLPIRSLRSWLIWSCTITMILMLNTLKILPLGSSCWQLFTRFWSGC